MKSHEIPVVWTNDDIGAGNEPQLRRQLEMLDRHGIPGVFFVIPCNENGDLDKDEALLRLIAEARKNGHEFHQHGYKHFCFECGVPVLDMFHLDPWAKNLYDTDRDSIEALHTLEALVEMLSNGQRIWLRAFGELPVGFRPGWGSYCGNLYKALKMLGYQWVSSRVPSGTSYAQMYGAPIEFYPGVQVGPHLLKQGIWEFPIGPEVAWRIPNDPQLIDAMVDLGVRHFQALQEKKEPMLIVSHFHGLEFAGNIGGKEAHPGGTGYQVHEKYLPWLIANGAKFMGMKELSEKYSVPAV
jgi:peptidoglycan/xylan/chitin deacetylase (PgdA/CDA1 family)